MASFHQPAAQNPGPGEDRSSRKKRHIASIATNSYLAAGGDGYKIFLEALDRYETSTFQRDALIEYIMKARNRLTPRLEGKIEIGRSSIIENSTTESSNPLSLNSQGQILGRPTTLVAHLKSVIARECNDRSNPTRSASRPETAAGGSKDLFSYRKIPRSARDSALHWIATLPPVVRNDGERRDGRNS